MLLCFYGFSSQKNWSQFQLIAIQIIKLCFYSAVLIMVIIAALKNLIVCVCVCKLNWTLRNWSWIPSCRRFANFKTFSRRDLEKWRDVAIWEGLGNSNGKDIGQKGTDNLLILSFVDLVLLSIANRQTVPPPDRRWSTSVKLLLPSWGGPHLPIQCCPHKLITKCVILQLIWWQLETPTAQSRRMHEFLRNKHTLQLLFTQP